MHLGCLAYCRDNFATVCKRSVHLNKINSVTSWMIKKLSIQGFAFAAERKSAVLLRFHQN